MTTCIRHLLAVTASIAAATACGGDGEQAPKAIGAQRTIQADAQRRAEKIVLEPRDLPRGWRAAPSRRDSEAEDMLRRCVGLDFSALTIIGEAFSKNFAAPQSEASSTATVFADEAQAEDAFDRRVQGMGSDAAPGCFGEQIEELNGVEVDEVDVFRLRASKPRGIEGSAAWQLVVSITLSPESPSSIAYLELVALHRADTVATLQSTSVRPFEPALRARLVRALARRM